jgi:hypothetical protein
MAHERLNRGIFVELRKAPDSLGFSRWLRGILAASFTIRAMLSGSRKEALLSESEDWSFRGRRVAPGMRPPARPHVSFDRRELDAILRVYGRKVAEGEWRDYAIDHLEDRAVFSIFRRAREMPIYRVEKLHASARRQGAYRIVTPTGLIVTRGQDLAGVLRAIDRPKLALVRG